jgi:hypothetical protein
MVRERKKAEHEELQNALEQLTAQLAAMKALEVQVSTSCSPVVLCRKR